MITRAFKQAFVLCLVAFFGTTTSLAESNAGPSAQDLVRSVGEICGRIARQAKDIKVYWPAPGSEDTELGVLMELEVGHGETSVYARVQA